MATDYDFWDFDEPDFSLPDDTAPAGSKLALLDGEQAWLDTYLARLDEQFPDLVQEVTVYGPRARRPAASPMPSPLDHHQLW